MKARRGGCWDGSVTGELCHCVCMCDGGASVLCVHNSLTNFFDFHCYTIRKIFLAFSGILRHLKVHKHEIIFLTFFAETESLWSQGPGTRDFWKSYSIRPRYSTFKHFRAYSACDEIGSQYAQHAMKLVPRMLSALKKISVMHVIKLGFAPVSFPPG